MANEKRLIDANAFWNLLQQVVYDIFTAHEHNGQLTGTASVGYYTTTIQEVLKQTPTVDAVEVVRCKDCKHRGSNLCPMETVELYPWFGSKNDAFCSYGERREGE